MICSGIVKEGARVEAMEDDRISKHNMNLFSKGERGVIKSVDQAHGDIYVQFANKSDWIYHKENRLCNLRAEVSTALHQGSEKKPAEPTSYDMVRARTNMMMELARQFQFWDVHSRMIIHNQPQFPGIPGYPLPSHIYNDWNQQAYQVCYPESQTDSPLGPSNGALYQESSHVWIETSRIRFTHDAISPVFTKDGPHYGQDIRTLHDQLKLDEGISSTLGLEVAIHPASKADSSLATNLGQIYILNSGNRRLYCLRRAGIKYVLCTIVPYHRINPRAFTSQNGGINVIVRKDARHVHASSNQARYDQLIREQIKNGDYHVTQGNVNKLATKYEHIGEN